MRLWQQTIRISERYNIQFITGRNAPPPFYLSHTEKQVVFFLLLLTIPLTRGLAHWTLEPVWNSPPLPSTSILSPHPNFHFSFSSQKLKHMQSYASPFFPIFTALADLPTVTLPFTCSHPRHALLSLWFFIPVGRSHLSPFPLSFTFINHGPHTGWGWEVGLTSCSYFL